MKLCPHPQCNTGFPDHVETCPTHGGILNEIRELKPGMVIHKTYRIVRKLGKGGMGIVYLADQLYMKQKRALKFLSSELCEDSAFTDRFRQEVQALRLVRHKNVVGCGDLEPAEDDSLFFAMEFVEGPNLYEFLRTAPHPFDVELALKLTHGIAEGLGAAHALGIVHRDIKPENILMARTGDTWIPKIADFGIVASKERGNNRTRTGGTLLTPPYAAPEQWVGMKAADLDGRTDLYALGGVLFEMLTGRTVFEAESYEGWMDQHRNAAPKSPSLSRPELKNWRGLDELVLYLLAKDRDKRPEIVAQFLTHLSSVQYFAPASRQQTVIEEPAVRAATKAEPGRSHDQAVGVKGGTRVEHGTQNQEQVRKKAIEHNNRGLALMNKGQIDAAIEELSEALHLRPDLALAHVNLGQALLRKRKLNPATAEFKEALRLEPGLAVAHNNLGFAHWKNGERDAAAAEYREALRLQPDMARAHNNLGLFYICSGEIDKSIAEFRTALRLEPNLKVARSNLLQATLYTFFKKLVPFLILASLISAALRHLINSDLFLWVEVPSMTLLGAVLFFQFLERRADRLSIAGTARMTAKALLAICVLIGIGFSADFLVEKACQIVIPPESWTGKLVGTVKNNRGLPVSGVTVTLWDTLEPDANGEPKLRYAKTDSNGSYEFDSLPYSTAYYLVFDAEGFYRKEGSAGVVKDNQTTLMDTVMELKARSRKK